VQRAHIDILATFNQTDDDVVRSQSRGFIMTHKNKRDIAAPAAVSAVPSRLPDPHVDGLQNFNLKVAAHERALLEQRFGLSYTPMSETERAAGARRLAAEDPDARQRRERLMASFGRYVTTGADARYVYVFPSPLVAGEWLSAHECFLRVEAGAEFGLFYRLTAQAQRREPPRDAR
jgi:hypothetical protein